MGDALKIGGAAVVLASLLLSEQIAHGSVSVRFPQTEQNFMVSFASLIASDNAKASSSFIERMWRASLWAVLSPIPGRRASSLINLFSGFA